MTQTNADKFFKWFDNMEHETGLSDRKVAERGHFVPSLISKHRKLNTVPGYDLCAKIALAFHIEPIEVFRIAGLLPPPLGYDPEFEIEKDWFDLMSPDEKRIYKNLLWLTIENRLKK